MDLYPWVVIGHVVFVILAFGAHGVSAFAMFRVKAEPDRARAAAVLDLSTVALAAAGIGLLVAVVLGIVAAAMAGYFGRLWPWASIVVVVLIWLAMTPLAANPMSEVRRQLGLPTRNDKKGVAPQAGLGRRPRGSACQTSSGTRGCGRRRGHRDPGVAHGDETVLTLAGRAVRADRLEALMDRTLALLALPIVVLALAACSSAPGASGAAPSVAGPATLAGTVWTVTSVGGTFVDAANPPTMDFAADGTLSGTTGCNQFNGTYTVDGSSLTVSPLNMTMMMCVGPIGDGEALFAPAIQGATSWAMDADGNLLLSGAGDILAKPSGG